jgi:hypothetical protein
LTKKGTSLNSPVIELNTNIRMFLYKKGSDAYIRGLFAKKGR